jgi:hypothetical protein
LLLFDEDDALTYGGERMRGGKPRGACANDQDRSGHGRLTIGM